MIRQAAAAFGALLLATALTPSSAVAGISGDSGEWESDKSGSLGINGGLYYPVDTDLQSVYGTNGLLQWNLNLGYRIVDIFKIDAGAFLLIDRGNPLGQLTDDSSAETSTLSLLGFNLGPVLRLDFFEEQPIVPYGGVGLTWALFKEQVGDDAEAVVGDKSGWYYSVGLELLLDRFEPTRAADLDISRGINDTYLTLEYRHQVLTEVGETSQLDFTSENVTIGLKFDF